MHSCSLCLAQHVDVHCVSVKKIAQSPQASYLVESCLVAQVARAARTQYVAARGVALLHRFSLQRALAHARCFFLAARESTCVLAMHTCMLAVWPSVRSTPVATWRADAGRPPSIAREKKAEQWYSRQRHVVLALRHRGLVVALLQEMHALMEARTQICICWLPA